MDKSKMNYASAILFEHMRVGIVFFVYAEALTLVEVSKLSQSFSVSNNTLNLVIKNLVSHGIISSSFIDKHELVYCITEFGKYFYKELCGICSEAAELCERVGD